MVTIVYVNDDPCPVKHTKRKLNRFNFDVQTFLTGREAVRSIENGLSYDILITDMALTDIGGDQVEDASKQYNPQSPVIACSAYYPDIPFGDYKIDVLSTNPETGEDKLVELVLKILVREKKVSEKIWQQYKEEVKTKFGALESIMKEK